MSSKYTEVREALQARQAQLVESQKKADFLVPLVQTLETALDESRRKHEEQSQELSALRSKTDFDIRGDPPAQNIDTGLGLARLSALLHDIEHLLEHHVILPLLARARPGEVLTMLLQNLSLIHI